MCHPESFDRHSEYIRLAQYRLREESQDKLREGSQRFFVGLRPPQNDERHFELFIVYATLKISSFTIRKRAMDANNENVGQKSNGNGKQNVVLSWLNHRIWAAGKFLILLVVIWKVLEFINNFLISIWAPIVLHRFPIFTDGNYAYLFQSIASFILIVLSLIITGFFLVDISYVRRALDFVSKHVSLIRYVWSGSEAVLDNQYFTPVLFEYQRKDHFKIGFNVGVQKTDFGMEAKKIYFFTGIGDHDVIRDRTKETREQSEWLDEMLSRTGVIPLSNSSLEVAKLIMSCMVSGPRVLNIKRGGRINIPPDKGGTS